MAEFVKKKEMAEIKEQITELQEDYPETLSEWEEQFLDTLADWTGCITVSQAEKLRKMYEETVEA